MTTGPEVKTASTKKDQTRIPTDNHSSLRPSETGINFQLIQHRQTQSKDSELPLSQALEENEQHRVYIILIVNWGLF